MPVGHRRNAFVVRIPVFVYEGVTYGFQTQKEAYRIPFNCPVARKMRASPLRVLSTMNRGKGTGSSLGENYGRDR
jgi:hypothetical protein